MAEGFILAKCSVHGEMYCSCWHKILLRLRLKRAVYFNVKLTA